MADEEAPKPAAVAARKKSAGAPQPSAIRALAETSASAMAHVAMTLAQLDEAEPGDFAALVAQSSAALSGLSKKIDLYGAIKREMEAWAETARERAKWLTDRARAIETMLESADSHLIAESARNPEMPLAGDAYRVKIVNNGGVESLRILLARDDGSNPVREHVHLNKVIDSAFAFEANISADYLIEETYVRLNMQAIRTALDCGVEIKWAKLERGKRVTIKEA